MRHTVAGLCQLPIAMSTPNGSGNQLAIELELLDNAPLGASPLTLASVRLHDGFGRDFITSFANNQVTRQSGTITVTKGGVGNIVYLPLVAR